MDSSQQNAGAAMAAAAGSFALIGIIALAMTVFFVYIYWRIAVKAGYPGAMSLLLLIPLANFVVLIMFAFSEWPIEVQLKALRGGSAPPPGTMLQV
jgi:hypothetical protein